MVVAHSSILLTRPGARPPWPARRPAGRVACPRRPHARGRRPRDRTGVGDLAVVYLGVFPTAVAFTTWGYVLARSNAGTTSSTTYVVPAIALLMSWVLLAEAPAPAMLAGGLLCLLGVVIVRWPDRTARAVPPEQTVPVRAMERC